MKIPAKTKKNIGFQLVDLPEPQAAPKMTWRFVVMECIAVFLAYIALSISIGSIEQAQWLNPQPSLITAMTLGLILAFILARIRIPGFISVLLSVIFGLLVVTWESAGIFPDTDLTASLPKLFAALGSAVQMMFTGNPVEGTLHFAVFLLLISWFTGFYSIWYLLKRKNCWITLMTGLLIILVNLGNLPADYYGSFFYFLAVSIVLIVATHLLKYPDFQEQKNGNYFSKRILILISMSLLSIPVVLTVWLAPEIHAESATSSISWAIPFKADINEFFYNFLAKVPSKQQIKSSEFAGMISMTDPVDLSDTEQFVINSKKPFYWRTHVFDTYINNGWKNSSLVSSPSIQTDINKPGSDNSTKYSRINFTVTNKVKTDIVLYAGKIESVNIPCTFRKLEPPMFNINLIGPYRDYALPEDVVSVAKSLRLARTIDKPFGIQSVNLRLPSDLVLKSIGESRNDPTEDNVQLLSKNGPLNFIQLARKVSGHGDVISVTASPAKSSEQQYSVVSLVYNPTSGDLIKAGENYPHDITDFYLQLPSSVPDRVIEMARSVTRDSKNPYEKVQALKRFLSQIPYTAEATESIPGGMDAIDYFLNNKKNGNCFYFASAEVVMLRASGVPARLVVGYLTEDWNPISGTAVIRARNYHAWAEVYFPDHGWIEFEVTPSPVNTPDIGFGEGITDLEDIALDEASDTAAEFANQSSDSGVDFRYVIAGIAAVLIAAGTLIGFRLRKYFKSNYISRIYRQLNLLGIAARQGPGPQQTPYEYSKQLTQSIPQVSDSIEAIFSFYVESRYGPVKNIDAEHRETIARHWHRVRNLLLRRIFFL
jgi:hypothetical protein